MGLTLRRDKILPAEKKLVYRQDTCRDELLNHDLATSLHFNYYGGLLFSGIKPMPECHRLTSGFHTRHSRAGISSSTRTRRKSLLP